MVSVRTGVAAPSTVDTKPATASGSARPAGVDTNRVSPISANTTAPPGTRAFAQITDPSTENKINAPTLFITDHPPRVVRAAGRGAPTRPAAQLPTGTPPARSVAARRAHRAAFARAPASAASAARQISRRCVSS